MGVDEEGNGELIVEYAELEGVGREGGINLFILPRPCFVFWIGVRKFWLNFSGYRQRHMEEKKILNIMKIILLRYYIAL